MRLEEIKKAIEELTDSEKKEFFSEVIPEICDASLTTEGCRMIFEKKLSGPGTWNPLTNSMICKTRTEIRFHLPAHCCESNISQGELLDREKNF